MAPLATVRETDEKFEALYVLAVSTGMRQGKLLGLKWDDVDLDAGTLQVRRTLSTATGGGFRFGPPKTAKSRRSIRLPSIALAALKRHRKTQLEERTKLAGLFVDRGMVFTSQTGTPVMRQDLITRSFKPLLRKARLPDIRFHDLRYTCATLLLVKGVHIKLMQEALRRGSLRVGGLPSAIRWSRLPPNGRTGVALECNTTTSRTHERVRVSASDPPEKVQAMEGL